MERPCIPPSSPQGRRVLKLMRKGRLASRPYQSDCTPRASGSNHLRLGEQVMVVIVVNPEETENGDVVATVERVVKGMPKGVAQDHENHPGEEHVDHRQADVEQEEPARRT